MTRIHFVGRDGTESAATAKPGARLLDVAQKAGQPLEGTCDGQMACATCHVIVAADDLALLPPPSEEEGWLLDMEPAATRYSRLACQIRVPDADSLTVHIPG